LLFIFIILKLLIDYERLIMSRFLSFHCQWLFFLFDY